MPQFETQRVNAMKKQCRQSLQEKKVYEFSTQAELIDFLKEYATAFSTKDLGDGWFKICRDGLFGIMDANGKIILKPIYRHLSISDTKDLFTVQNRDYEYGVIDIHEKEIVPFGKFAFICNIVHGFTRVRIAKEGWAIIDSKGNVLINGFSEIWGFNEKYDSFVVTKKGRRYTVSIEALEALRLSIINGDGKITQESVLNDNPFL